jgi:hypothetical protein
MKIAFFSIGKCGSSLIRRSLNPSLRKRHGKEMGMSPEEPLIEEYIFARLWPRHDADPAVIGREDYFTLTMVRHPIERFFSGIFFSHAVVKSWEKTPPSIGRKKYPNWSDDNRFDKLDYEDKIKYVLKHQSRIGSPLLSSTEEVNDCMPDYLLLREEALKKIDLVMVIEKLDQGLDRLEALTGVKIKNVKANCTAPIEKSVFKSTKNKIRKELKEKYWDKLSELFAPDIEIYERYNSKYK